MNKIFYIMGKSASGKDTMYKALLDKLIPIDIKGIIQYTTRPIRNGEMTGIDYHFVTEEAMMKLKEDGKVIEMRSYDTEEGIWRYATVYDHQFEDHDGYFLMVGTLESFAKVKEYFGKEMMVPIYVEVGDRERLLRAINRESMNTNPNYSEVCRRFIADEKDFSKENLKNAGIDIIFNNNIDKELCIKTITDYILCQVSKDIV